MEKVKKKSHSKNRSLVNFSEKSFELSDKLSIFCFINAILRILRRALGAVNCFDIFVLPVKRLKGIGPNGAPLRARIDMLGYLAVSASVADGGWRPCLGGGVCARAGLEHDDDIADASAVVISVTSAAWFARGLAKVGEHVASLRTKLRRGLSVIIAREECTKVVIPHLLPFRDEVLALLMTSRSLRRNQSRIWRWWILKSSHMFFVLSEMEEDTRIILIIVILLVGQMF